MSYFRFVLRFLALTGLLVAGLAGIVCASELSDATRVTLEESWKGRRGELAQYALWALAGGGLTALVIFAFDLLMGMGGSATRRSALGMNVILQVILAVVLLVGVNVWSFLHYRRWDVTRERQFTIRKDIADELKKLQGETTIVVYLQHKTFGRYAGKTDPYDNAAEQKVVEKVEDLVALLREFGPQFRVVVLDVNEKQYDHKLAAEARRFPKLEAAIKAAPENSILFCAGDNVQRMSFNEFYQLDKPASLAADQGRGNLVLLPQGIEPFARHVLAIEEKRPRIGIAVIHEVLTTQSTEDSLSMAGVRKSLTENGFEVRDIILKKWGEEAPKPTAYTFDESRLEQVEEELAELNLSIPTVESERNRFRLLAKMLKEKTLDELNVLLREELRGRTMTDQDRQLNLNRFEGVVTALESELGQMQDERRKIEAEQASLMSRESVVEGRYVTDLKVKSRRLIDDCDALIIPRMTLMNLLSGSRIAPRFYRLDDAQLAAVRDFMRAGKPVFALFGPTNEPGAVPDSGDSDALEVMFRELGIVFADQTILYTVESRAFAERRVNPIGGARAIEYPPLDFESAGTPGLTDAATRPNPLREGLKLVARSSGQKLDLVLRHPRPVYFSSVREHGTIRPEFLITDAATWNEAKPFPDRSYTPRFEVAKAEDAKHASREDERRGPFPVGVALETTVPPEWASEKYRALKAAALVLASHPQAGLAALTTEVAMPTDPYTRTDAQYRPISLRVAAIGHGGVFVSPDAAHPELSPAQEQLLLQTLNWLLKRDDRLPRADQVWQYPRVEISRRASVAWIGGALIGLPLVFAYLGCIILMARKTR